MPSNSEKITFEENMAMSHFLAQHQQSIAEDVFSKYNTSDAARIMSALRQAAWLGFLAGMDAMKEKA